MVVRVVAVGKLVLKMRNMMVKMMMLRVMLVVLAMLKLAMTELVTVFITISP